MAIKLSGMQSQLNLKSELLKKSEEVSGKTIRNIPIEKLISDERNKYNMDDAELEELKDNIRASGFWGSVMIVDNKDGTYRVAAGHRRVRAMYELGYKTIPSMIYDSEDEIVEDIFLDSNFGSRTMYPMDYAIAAQNYREYFDKKRQEIEEAGKAGKSVTPLGKTRALIAKKLRCSEAQVYRYESILKMDPAMQQILSSTKDFPLSAISGLAQKELSFQQEVAAKILAFFEKAGERKIEGPDLEKILKSCDTKEETEPEIKRKKKEAGWQIDKMKNDAKKYTKEERRAVLKKIKELADILKALEKEEN